MKDQFDSDTQAAIDAFKTGGDVAPEALATESATPMPEAEIEQADPEETLDNASSDEELIESQEIEDLGEDGGEPDLPDIGYVMADGKKIKVDYTDRSRIDKVHQMAAGMRKFQSERDEATKRGDDYKSKYEENQKTIGKIDDLMESKDWDQAFKVLTGRDLSEVVEERMEEAGKLSKMSPEELGAYQDKRQVESKLRAIEKREAAAEAKEAKATEDLNASDLNKQQAMIDTAFAKSRFAGTMGDAKREYRADKILWDTALNKLNSQESVTQEDINNAMTEAAKELREIGMITTQKENKKKATTQKKVATKKAQSAAFSDSSNESKRVELSNKVKSGDLGDLSSGISGILSGAYNSIF